MVCLASSLIAVAVAVILKHVALENSVAYKIAGGVAVAGAVLSFPIGFWIAGRPRYCPKCNTEMEPMKEKPTLIFKCPNCGFEYDTHMDSLSVS